MVGNRLWFPDTECALILLWCAEPFETKLGMWTQRSGSAAPPVHVLVEPVRSYAGFEHCHRTLGGVKVAAVQSVIGQVRKVRGLRAG